MVNIQIYSVIEGCGGGGRWGEGNEWIQGIKSVGWLLSRLCMCIYLASVCIFVFLWGREEWIG